MIMLRWAVCGKSKPCTAFCVNYITTINDTEKKMKWTSPQCVYAGLSLMLGFLLVYLDFFLTETHEIHDNSLWVLGQCFIFAGTVFGFKGYIDGKFIKFKEDMRNGNKAE